MRTDQVSEQCLMISELGPWRPFQFAAAVEYATIPGILEVVPALDSIGIYFHSETPELGTLEKLFHSGPGLATSQSHLHIPVCYEIGPDIDSVSAAIGLSMGEVIELHSGTEFVCEAVGFQPGFPYLSGLHESLSGMKRLGSPRARVPKGAVGITASYCGIYPNESPGGWNLIGVTPLEIVALKDAYFPISPGDRVTFFPISETEFYRLKGDRL